MFAAHSTRVGAWILACWSLLTAMTVVAGAEDDLTAQEEQAIQAAVARVAPSVVRIETVGGLETIGRFQFGTGPTTGLVVSADGYIVSSSFNFAQKPAQILVNLGAGSPVPAELVSTDFNRHMVLLKVASSSPLSVAEPAPLKDVRVGQWAIAVGRTFGDGKKPNVSEGIVSATNRIWGRAIQTDAKISPSNYGGPLIDIHGRVLGVLAPLAQDGFGAPGPASEIAGVEWYDSGIGFAVPLEHINELVPRMQKEKELRPGKLGVSIKGNDLFSGDVIIAAVAAGSPVQQAGFKAGDKIVELAGAKITRQAEMRHALMPRYAGDKVKLVALRGSERIEREIELVAEIAPYQYPFLGILPLRESSSEAGVVVRYVYPDSPAGKSDLKPLDRIVALGGKPVTDRESLLEHMAAEAAGKEVELSIRRGDEEKQHTLKLATLPEEIPADLPPAHGDILPPDGDRQATGLVSIKIPEAANDCFAYVPDTYAGNIPHGVVLWLHAAGGYKEEELVDTWKEHCAARDLILLAPKSADPDRWQRSELAFIRKALDDLVAKYSIDRKRIAVAGAEAGGAMAYLFAFANRELAAGVIAIGAPLPPGAQIPPADPVMRHAFFMAGAKESPVAPQVKSTAERIRAAKYPVTEKDLGEASRPLSADERSELARWIDALDRI
jgi:serine protease Do